MAQKLLYTKAWESEGSHSLGNGSHAILLSLSYSGGLISRAAPQMAVYVVFLPGQVYEKGKPIFPSDLQLVI